MMVPMRMLRLYPSALEEIAAPGEYGSNRPLPETEDYVRIADASGAPRRNGLIYGSFSPMRTNRARGVTVSA